LLQLFGVLVLQPAGWQVGGGEFFATKTRNHQNSPIKFYSFLEMALDDSLVKKS
jgi:hypothetical protein